MSISPLYVPLFTIEEVILDKDSGLPLSGGIVSFYRDSQRLTPKPVYKITGSSPNYTFTSVGTQLTLGIAGDFVDDNGDPFVPYAYPYDSDGEVDLYYVTVVSEGLVAQFVREAVPFLGTGAIPPEDRASTENELSNPQFVEILFPGETAFEIDVTGSNTVTPIAPGWDLVTSGSGTVTLQRLEPTSANTDTNPPYTLSITAAAALGASITLRQRLLNSPSIGRGKFASGSILAAVISGGASAISMTYAPSTGTSTTIIPSTNIPTDGAYHVIADNAQVTQQVNTAASTGYVDINIVIPTSRTIALSSIQVVFVPTELDVPFDEQTADRQKDHLFHYYEESILIQPKNNLLAGWTFALNPYQFISPTISVKAPKTSYIADQTILYQETASALRTGESNQDSNYVLSVLSVNGVNANRFALIQYIDTTTIEPYWGQVLSALVRAAWVHRDGALPTPQLKMRLIWRTSAVPTLANNEPITGFDADGDPTFAAGWNAILPLNDPAYTLLDISGETNRADFPAWAFDQFQLPIPTSLSIPIYLGVVVYINKPLNNTLNLEDYILFSKVSLVPNDFAIDASTETFDESLRKCQFYYEKSYNWDVLPGTAPTSRGSLMFNQHAATSGGNTVFWPSAFTIPYKVGKRGAPSIVIYSPVTGATNRLSATATANSYNSSTVTDYDVSSNYSSTLTGYNGANYFPVGGALSTSAVGSTTQPQVGYLNLHFSADARLGI